MAGLGSLIVRVAVTGAVLALLGACFLSSFAATGILLYLIWR